MFKQWILAGRALARRPGFVCAVVAVLALGIGANTAMFSVVDAVLLKPLPYPHADRLVTVFEASAAKKERTSLIAPARLEDWNRMNRTFDGIAASYFENVTDTSAAEPERLDARRVSPRFFQVMGAAPVAGRTFTANEEVYGGPLAAVISYGFWSRRFQKAPDAVGRRLILGGKGYTIVGVMPREFASGTQDVWLAAQIAQPLMQMRDARFYAGVGRMKPGVTIGQAQGDLARVQEELGREYPQTDKGWSALVGDLKEARTGDYRRALLVVFGALGLLLAIAVANIAGLMLTQLYRRERELAIRCAIGGSRMQIAGGVMREVAIIAAAGAGLGCAIAAWLMDFLGTELSYLPRSAEFQLDWRAMVFAAGAGMLAAMLSGLLPAFAATRAGVAAVLAQSGRGGSGARNRWQTALVAGQVAITVVLLAGAGLMLRSYYNLSHVDLGLEPAQAITFHAGAAWDEDRTRVGQFQKDLVARLEQAPGVEAAGFTNFLPAMGATLRYQVTLEGLAQTEEGGKITVGERSITSGYLKAMGATLVSGQSCPDLSAISPNQPKALVSRRFAELYGQGQSLVGRHLRGMEFVPGTQTEIVGVVGDMREDTLNVRPAPYVYVCIVPGGWPDPEYVVRTQGSVQALAASIGPVVHAIDPGRAVFGVKTLREALEAPLEQPRLNADMLALFAASAMFLAMIGLYGLVTLAVAARTREIGVRMALGANPGAIAADVLRMVARLVAAGIAAGLILTLAADRVLRSVLFGVSPMDPASLVGTIVAMAAVSLLAVLPPAIRAAKTDPLIAIRAE